MLVFCNFHYKYLHVRIFVLIRKAASYQQLHRDYKSGVLHCNEASRSKSVHSLFLNGAWSNNALLHLKVYWHLASWRCNHNISPLVTMVDPFQAFCQVHETKKITPSAAAFCHLPWIPLALPAWYNVSVSVHMEDSVPEIIYDELPLQCLWNPSRLGFSWEDPCDGKCREGTAGVLSFSKRAVFPLPLKSGYLNWVWSIYFMYIDLKD